MGFNSQQITVTTTAVGLIQEGSGGTTFVQTHGAVGDELPAIIQNTSASVTVYLGGPNVSTSNGFPLVAGASLPINFLGHDSRFLFAVTASSAVVAVLLGRQ